MFNINRETRIAYYTIPVRNVPCDLDCEKYKYILASVVDGQLYYHGADHDKNRAYSIAKQLSDILVIEII